MPRDFWKPGIHRVQFGKHCSRLGSWPWTFSSQMEPAGARISWSLCVLGRGLTLWGSPVPAFCHPLFLWASTRSCGTENQTDTFKTSLCTPQIGGQFRRDQRVLSKAWWPNGKVFVCLFFERVAGWDMGGQVGCSFYTTSHHRFSFFTLRRLLWSRWVRIFFPW